MYTINTQRLPIKLWLSDIEEGALEQAKHLADLDFAFHHIAIMPDAHQGYGMPIGGVLATIGAVVPNAVGVDVGCGMIAVKTNLDRLTSKQLTVIHQEISRRIPTGFSHHKQPHSWEGFKQAPDVPVVQRELKSAAFQLGTLGGGNHFIEIQKGDDGHIYLMLHSGSRNFGYTIAREFAALARNLAVKNSMALPDMQLAPLFLDTPEGQDYLAAMEYAQKFAAQSRARMMDEVLCAVTQHAGDCKVEDEVNIHHNFARIEEHFGREVVVHRKGATSARKGERGIIPGSQGTASFIVEGLGNPESFYSCSHGAGRVMGRKEARRRLDLSTEQKRLAAGGVQHSLRSTRDLDEAPSAYKDIETVIAEQRDLVKPVVRLSPLLVIKG